MHLSLKNFCACAYALWSVLYTIVLLFVPTVVDQSIFQMTNQISCWSAIMS